MTKTKHIGRIIRNRREKYGWSLEYASDKCNICMRSLENIELGKTDPHLSTVLQIAAGLGIDVGELNSCLPESNKNNNM